jgi:hypothetical protein
VKYRSSIGIMRIFHARQNKSFSQFSLLGYSKSLNLD